MRSDDRGPLSEAIHQLKMMSAQFRVRPLYEDSISLVRAIEDRVGRRKPWMHERFARWVYVPIRIVFKGLAQLASSPYKVVLTVYILSLAFKALGAIHSSLGEIAQAGFFVSTACLIWAFAFAAPSTFCVYGIKDEYVGATRDFLAQRDYFDTKRIELLIKNLKPIEDRVKARLSIFRWMLGFAWAILSPLASEIIKTATTQGTSVDLQRIAPSLAWLVGAFVLVEAYARGVDIVFRSIEFGCNERLARINSDEAIERGPSRANA